MTRPAIPPAFAAVVVSFLLPGSAAAYELFGRYDPGSIPVPYSVDTTRLPYGLEPVQAAANRWSTHPRIGFAFQFRGAGRAFVRHDGVNTVRMDQGQMGGGVLGLTYRWSNANGRLLGFDMEFNGRWSWTPSQFANTATHEFGHALGLDHSRDMGAIMKPMADARIVELTPDDVAGAAALYPVRGGSSGGSTGTTPTTPTTTVTAAPRVLAPTGTTSARPTVRWTEVPGARSYEVAIDLLDPRLGQTSARRVGSLTRAELVVSRYPLANGSYMVFVRAQTSTGPGPWSAPGSFTVSDVVPPPATPTALAPAGRSDQVRPTFRWAAAANAVTYELAIDRLEGGQQVKVVRAGPLPSTAHAPAQPLAPGRYRWFVRSLNARGASGWATADVELTAPLPVVAAPPAPLGAPILRAPLTGTATVSPAFSWTAVTGATGYELRVEGPNGVALHEAALATLEHTPRTALAVGEYTWWLRARRGATVGPWEGATFSVELTPPLTFGEAPLGPPILRAPLTDTPSPTPAFSWSAVTDATSYELRVEDLQGVVIHEEELTTLGHTPAAALPPGEYTWWLRARRGATVGPWEGTTFSILDASAIGIVGTMR